MIKCLTRFAFLSLVLLGYSLQVSASWVASGTANGKTVFLFNNASDAVSWCGGSVQYDPFLAMSSQSLSSPIDTSYPYFSICPNGNQVGSKVNDLASASYDSVVAGPGTPPAGASSLFSGSPDPVLLKPMSCALDVFDLSPSKVSELNSNTSGCRYTHYTVTPDGDNSTYGLSCDEATANDNGFRCGVNVNIPLYSTDRSYKSTTSDYPGDALPLLGENVQCSGLTTIDSLSTSTTPDSGSCVVTGYTLDESQWNNTFTYYCKEQTAKDTYGKYCDGTLVDPNECFGKTYQLTTDSFAGGSPDAVITDGTCYYDSPVTGTVNAANDCAVYTYTGNYESLGGEVHVSTYSSCDIGFQEPLQCVSPQVPNHSNTACIDPPTAPGNAANASLNLGGNQTALFYITSCLVRSSASVGLTHNPPSHNGVVSYMLDYPSVSSNCPTSYDAGKKYTIGELQAYAGSMYQDVGLKLYYPTNQWFIDITGYTYGIQYDLDGSNTGPNTFSLVPLYHLGHPIAPGYEQGKSYNHYVYSGFYTGFDLSPYTRLTTTNTPKYPVVLGLQGAGFVGGQSSGGSEGGSIDTDSITQRQDEQTSKLTDIQTSVDNAAEQNHTDLENLQDAVGDLDTNQEGRNEDLIKSIYCSRDPDYSPDCPAGLGSGDDEQPGEHGLSDEGATGVIDAVGSSYDAAGNAAVDVFNEGLDDLTDVTPLPESTLDGIHDYFLNVIPAPAECSPLVLGGGPLAFEVSCESSNKFKQIFGFLLAVYTVLKLIDILTTGITPLRHGGKA